MHLQRSPESTDRNEEVGELGLLTQQLGELVDHDEQAGSGARSAPAARAFS